MISVVTNAENWSYNSGSGGPDLTDIIIIAQIHAWLGDSHKQKNKIPPMDGIKSFSKLEVVGLTPAKSIEMLAEAKGQIAEIRRLISQ